MGGSRIGIGIYILLLNFNILHLFSYYLIAKYSTYFSQFHSINNEKLFKCFQSLWKA